MSTLAATSAASSSTALASPSSASPSLRSLKPPAQPGMRELDRSAFTVKLNLISARVPASQVGRIRKDPALFGQVLDIAKLKSIVSDTDPAYKRLMLRVTREDELPAATREFLAKETHGFVEETIELGYDHWTTSDILNSIMPTGSGEDVPSSFTQTGHIAHVNLLDEWLPYKFLIGQVILDKVPTLRTVVNKLNTIHAEYRYFDMEVIAGEDNLITSMNESNCTFTFDFSKVYWNSRLHHEHERIISFIRPSQVVADVMAGVGPFAIPAAKKGCYVFGNDLNPESVRWMRENRLKNKVETTLRVSEVDGREFIRTVARQAWREPFERCGPPAEAKSRERQARQARKEKQAIQSFSTSTSTTLNPSPVNPTPTDQLPSLQSLSLDSPSPSAPQTVDHFIMNLPDSALTFLDAYNGCLAPLLDEPGYDKDKVILPMVHVHCFTREMERPGAEADICARATESLRYPVTPEMEGYILHLVRSVAPNKEMYCLSFRLPAEVAYARV